MPLSELLNIAKSILESMEDLDMLPPHYTRTDPGHFPGDDFDYDINEWEPEND